MVIQKLKTIRNEYRNYRGCCIGKKVVVFESDDWGSIRQPSHQCYRKQLNMNNNTATDPFFHYDAIERTCDLEKVLEVLSEYTDRVGNHAVITANYAVANPNFEAIQKSDFQSYHLEPIQATFDSYEKSKNMCTIIQQGISEGLWHPELHCREHLQITKWLNSLQMQDPDSIWAFNNRMISTVASISHDNRYGYMDAFNYDDSEEATDEIIGTIIDDAIDMFTDIFGYSPKTFTAPCYVWGDFVEKSLLKQGIDCMQGGWYRWFPRAGELQKLKHYNGRTNGDMLYLVRNCLFEHSLFGDDAVDVCLKQIESAFRWKQPAIISVHRVNFIGRIIEKNGDDGIYMLRALLSMILKKWPDVEFMTSAQLINEYNKGVLEGGLNGTK